MTSDTFYRHDRAKGKIYKILARKPEGEDYLGDVGLYRRIILKCIFIIKD
jgi:hypothetical protein